MDGEFVCTKRLEDCVLAWGIHELNLSGRCIGVVVNVVVDSVEPLLHGVLPEVDVPGAGSDIEVLKPAILVGDLEGLSCLIGDSLGRVPDGVHEHVEEACPNVLP